MVKSVTAPKKGKLNKSRDTVAPSPGPGRNATGAVPRGRGAPVATLAPAPRQEPPKKALRGPYGGPSGALVGGPPVGALDGGPSLLGVRIDNVAYIDAQIDALMGKVNELKRKRDEMVGDLLVTFNEERITSSKGAMATASVHKTRVATVKDWAAVEAYVYKHKAFDLFQRRITSSAYFDRKAEGIEIAGVEVFERVDMRIVRNRS